MKIAIDITALKTGHAIRGTGSYTKLLIEALQQYESKHSYHFFTRGQQLPKDIDLVHYPYFDPFFLTLPLRKLTPTVVTVHDLIPIAYEKHFSRGIRGELKWQIQRRSLSGVRAIITDSKISREDIISFACVTCPIKVIYLAPSALFRPMTDMMKLQKIRRTYDLPDKFVLYVGDVNWNKNIPGLLQAMREINIPIVLVGKAFHNDTLPEVDEINRLVTQLRIKVKKVGFVSDEHLVCLYNLASVCVQPSFAEGFGLPVLEAMACGCPVVCSNISSLAEIAGPSVLINPRNPNDIRDGIKKALRMNRKAWQHNAFPWVSQFSWRRTARETAKVYENAFHHYSSI